MRLQTARVALVAAWIPVAFLPLAEAADPASPAPSPAPPAPAAPAVPAPPDDTPTVGVGGTLFTNFTYTDKPKITDADGNRINGNSFEVTRAYVNVTGRISHLVSFRVTPDISGRFGTTLTGGSTGERAATSYDGSLVYRLKYAYGQVSLEDWLPKGTWIRIGQQQTPYIDALEGPYRYRFQGTVFPEREGFLSSSDVGLSGHYAFPQEYGDVHAGLYNGDTYTRAEANDQKAFQARVSVRPLARRPLWKGLRLTGFYLGDHYVKGAPRTRLIGGLTFEHKNVHVGFDYVDAKDQTSAQTAAVKQTGYDVWITPRTRFGLEGFLRYDSLKPSEGMSARKTRTIVGASYWFKTVKAPAAAAILADYESVDYDEALARPNEKRLAIHCLFNF